MSKEDERLSTSFPRSRLYGRAPTPLVLILYLQIGIQRRRRVRLLYFCLAWQFQHLLSIGKITVQDHQSGTRVQTIDPN